ncbi:MAG: trypsin-like peptidase domain-containing protein, partial [Candidatus Cloacimonetes bacterium]|nr:trypsin-like peptidase domain-containing protein [Candidatus Cloacimonadota bacterium]
MISNKRIAFIMIFILISITILNAQINQGGVPESFSRTLRQNVPFVEMPEVDVQAMLDEDEYNIQFKDVPWRFGKNNYVDLTLTNSGVWEELPNGDKIWRLGISSPGAYTINLTFDNYYLPENSRLFVYNEDHTHIIGAFTDFNNREDHVFATTLVQGDKITIEYFEPAKVEFRGELSLEMVTHGYRDAYGYARAFGSSGSCNNNVACPEGDPWVDEIKSAVMLVSGGSGFCSGALINNTSEDGTPYLLTADHCYSDPSSWVFWFNWQSSTCANPGSSPAYDSMSGATLRARNSDSDFCLVELGSTPPAGYNVFYSGWNRQDAASTSSVGIHHPSGDIKKISFDYDPCVTSDYDPSPYLADSHWEITQWDDGTTEGGSSGSPLFDQNHRIIGQLHGGWASCTSLTEDFYGKFSMSWDRGGSSSNQLEDWLDPTGIAGLTLDGYDPNSTTYPPVANFSADDTTPAVGQTVNFTDLSTNNPDTWSWSFNPTSITYVGGTSSTSENPQVQFNSTGQYTVTLYAENSYGNDTEVKTNYITAADCTVTSFPWSEGFENGGAIPDCWSQEYVVDTQDWEYQNGGHSSNPASAHSGSYNAYLYNASTTANVTHLITPPMDLSGFTSASLTFWHTQAYWSPDQDELRVYYKTSAAGSWNLLATYTSSITSWTEETLSLSGMSSDYYIGFEGTAQYGHGVCLDDIEIDGTASSPEITVTSPNGGEDWELDTTHNITWT